MEKEKDSWMLVLTEKFCLKVYLNPRWLESDTLRDQRVGDREEREQGIQMGSGFRLPASIAQFTSITLVKFECKYGQAMNSTNRVPTPSMNIYPRAEKA